SRCGAALAAGPWLRSLLTRPDGGPPAASPRPASPPRRARRSGARLRLPSRLQLGQLAIQPLLPLHPREGRVQVVLGHLEEGRHPRRLPPNRGLHAPQRGDGAAARGLERRLAGAGPRPGRPVLRDQQLLLLLGLAVLELQLPQRLPQELDLALEILPLVGEEL